MAQGLSYSSAAHGAGSAYASRLQGKVPSTAAFIRKSLTFHLDQFLGAEQQILINSIIADSKHVAKQTDRVGGDGESFLTAFFTKVQQCNRTNPIAPDELVRVIEAAADKAERIEGVFQQAARGAYMAANAGLAAGFEEVWTVLRAEVLRAKPAVLWLARQDQLIRGQYDIYRNVNHYAAKINPGTG